MHALIFYLVLLLLFLLLSLFFSGSETAYTAVNRLRLKYRAEAGDKDAERIKRIVSNPDRLLGVILLGNTLANIGAASLVTYLISEYFPAKAERISVVGTLSLTLVVLIFCELTPKIISAAHAELVSRKLLMPIRVSLWLLAPFAGLAAWCANRLVRLAGLSPGTSPFAHALSEDEIRAIIAGSTSESMGEEKREMLHNVFEIAATQVREIMIPRVEVTAVDIDDPLEESLALIRRTNYSRIPVYRRNFDNIIGILNIKDLLQYLDKPGDINLEVLLRPVHYVPDTARSDSVLRQLQSMHQHLAVVVDEYGGAEGIITMEDLLEEIVGEIRDEHDTEVEAVRELGPDLYSIAGNLPVKDFNRLFQDRIPESSDYTTVVGFLQTRTGRLLHEGEVVRYQGLSFSIEKAEGFRIVSIRVRVQPSREATPSKRVPTVQRP